MGTGASKKKDEPGDLISRLEKNNRIHSSLARDNVQQNKLLRVISRFFVTALIIICHFKTFCFNNYLLEYKSKMGKSMIRICGLTWSQKHLLIFVGFFNYCNLALGFSITKKYIRSNILKIVFSNALILWSFTKPLC